MANLKPTERGWTAHDFSLRGVDGKTYGLADVRGAKGTLVAFICNHCPYVKAIVDRLVEEAKALKEIGIGTIAVMPNDTAAYPADSFENMRTFARQHGFTFPYLIDETQEVARTYGAVCTPTSSASMRRTSCNTAAASTPRARAWCPTPGAISTRPCS